MPSFRKKLKSEIKPRKITIRFSNNWLDLQGKINWSTYICTFFKARGVLTLIASQKIHNCYIP